MAALAAPGQTLAATPVTAMVVTGSQCVSGNGPADVEVIATLKTPSGHVRGRFLTMSDPDGNWAGCFPAPINGADRLRIAAGSSKRTIIIPRVEPIIDRVANVIEGSAPADSPVNVTILHLASLRDVESYEFNAVSDGSGHYTIDTTDVFDLRGGDAVTVITQNGGDLFGAIVLAPHVNVLHANNLVVGTANNGTDLVLVLTDANGALKADVTAGSAPLFFGISAFQVSLFDDDGSAVYPLDGDLLTANLADDASLQIPVSSLSGSSRTDTVRGRCMPNASYALRAGFESFYGRTDSTGRFNRNVGRRMDLLRGDTLFLICLYDTGDTWTRTNVAL